MEVNWLGFCAQWATLPIIKLVGPGIWDWPHSCKNRCSYTLGSIIIYNRECRVARLVQSVERKVLNFGVLGSSPTVGVCDVFFFYIFYVNIMNLLDSNYSFLSKLKLSYTMIPYCLLINNSLICSYIVNMIIILIMETMLKFNQTIKLA